MDKSVINITDEQLTLPVKGTIIRDLIAVCNTIKTVSKRGTFDIEEYQPVGELYSRLTELIKETIENEK